MSDASMPEATELVAGYRDKSISPVEATQAALDAIEAYDDAVNAFVLVDPEDRELGTADKQAAVNDRHDIQDASIDGSNG